MCSNLTLPAKLFDLVWIHFLIYKNGETTYITEMLM